MGQLFSHRAMSAAQTDRQRTEKCACGGEITVTSPIAGWRPGELDDAIQAAVQAHQATTQHQAYLDPA